MFEMVYETKRHIINNYYMPLPAGSFKVLKKPTQSPGPTCAFMHKQEHTHTKWWEVANDNCQIKKDLLFKMFLSFTTHFPVAVYMSLTINKATDTQAFRLQPCTKR